MSFKAFAANARLAASHNSVLSDITQVRNLIVLRRWRHEEMHYQELFQTRCYADFAKPQDGMAFLSEQPLANQDYIVRGIDLKDRSVDDYIQTSAGFWLDGEIVAGEREGGIACDLLTYQEHYLTLDLYLRKKPEER